MKIAILSDSHDSIEKLEDAVEIIKKEEPKLILHAGDFCSPYTAFPFKGIDIPFIGVFGNNDGDKLSLREKYLGIGELFDYSKVVEIEGGYKILITHYPDLVDSLAKSGDYNCVIYGHTHQLDIRKDQDTQIINPGALSGHLAEYSSFVILETVTGKVKIIKL